MLGNYLKFNNNTFPNPVSVTRSSKTIENVSQSEAGTDLVCVVRAVKESWSMSFNLTSRTRDILKEICKEESTSLYYMGNTYTVRVRDFQEKLVQDSEWVSTSEGLYQVTVKITEF
jgi:hypothetical protein